MFRGTCKYFLDQYEEAIKDLDKAIELDPQYSDSWSYRGLCYYELDENEEAIDNFDRALDLNPNDERSFDYRSKALVKDKEN